MKVGEFAIEADVKIQRKAQAERATAPAVANVEKVPAAKPAPVKERRKKKNEKKI